MINYISILIQFLILLSSCSGDSFSKETDKAKYPEKTVADYFFRLPKDLLGPGLKTDEQRIAALLNSKNRYDLKGTGKYALIESSTNSLRLRAGLLEGSSEIVLASWKNTEHSDIIGIIRTYSDADSSETVSLQFYKNESNVWNEITDQIFPGIKAEYFEPYDLKPLPKDSIPDHIYCSLIPNDNDIACRFSLVGENPEDYYKKPSIVYHWKKDRFILVKE
ncbi:hypothetical protein LEP1GSC047_4247 [Leptospira inadai serovar Lyme str. 10]|uniref:Uncharacterized protein n=2 Tax=Leptospira inadai serovar Lyme TaxID=293084 RepID=V6HEM5_9LEPT|nr:hypothetical protein [Leptospira inadai]EQA37828.1 hypothetical protein LEP1GSC047_4247 [Leptospira inadai serovar Lyme str. 10]PNV73309.1 hypothetical protein BES34_017605 [Leptospira inadai serovar Lyme]